MLVAQVPIFLERLVDDPFEFRRHGGIEPHRSDRRAIQNLIENLRRAASRKALLPGDHFVQHQAERKNVRPPVEVFRARLLGRHVRQRAHRGAGRAQLQLLLRPRCVAIGAQFRLHLGQAKIENLRVAALGDENIRRLDIAVNDAFGVRRVQRVGDFRGQRQREVQLHRLAGDLVLQRGTIEKFHGDEHFAVLVVNFVDGADVRMIQGRSGFGFAFETRKRLGIFRDLVRKELQRHEAAELGVFRFVHHAHSATAEFLDNAEMRYRLTYQ